MTADATARGSTGTATAGRVHRLSNFCFSDVDDRRNRCLATQALLAVEVTRNPSASSSPRLFLAVVEVEIDDRDLLVARAGARGGRYSSLP